MYIQITRIFGLVRLEETYESLGKKNMKNDSWIGISKLISNKRQAEAYCWSFIVDGAIHIVMSYSHNTMNTVHYPQSQVEEQ